MSPPETDNPFELSPEHQERIRLRAYHLWESEGRPEGQAAEYWERARELDAMASNAPGMMPNPALGDSGPMIEEANLEENLGEFPSLMTDQGDTMNTPESRPIARAFRDGAR